MWPSQTWTYAPPAASAGRRSSSRTPTTSSSTGITASRGTPGETPTTISWLRAAGPDRHVAQPGLFGAVDELGADRFTSSPASSPPRGLGHRALALLARRGRRTDRGSAQPLWEPIIGDTTTRNSPASSASRERGRHEDRDLERGRQRRRARGAESSSAIGPDQARPRARRRRSADVASSRSRRLRRRVRLSAGALGPRAGPPGRAPRRAGRAPGAAPHHARRSARRSGRDRTLRGASPSAPARGGAAARPPVPPPRAHGARDSLAGERPHHVHPHRRLLGRRRRDCARRRPGRRGTARAPSVASRSSQRSHAAIAVASRSRSARAALEPVQRSPAGGAAGSPRVSGGRSSLTSRPSRTSVWMSSSTRGPASGNSSPRTAASSANGVGAPWQRSSARSTGRVARTDTSKGSPPAEPLRQEGPAAAHADRRVGLEPELAHDLPTALEVADQRGEEAHVEAGAHDVLGAELEVGARRPISRAIRPRSGRTASGAWTCG